MHLGPRQGEVSFSYFPCSSLGDRAKDGERDTPLLAAPWNCPLLGSWPRTGHSKHWLNGGRGDTPYFPCVLTLALPIPVD